MRRNATPCVTTVAENDDVNVPLFVCVHCVRRARMRCVKTRRRNANPLTRSRTLATADGVNPTSIHVAVMFAAAAPLQHSASNTYRPPPPLPSPPLTG